MTSSFRFIDLFAGLGGFHVAASRLSGKCVFACELDRTLRALYKQNFGMDAHGDINDVDTSRIPDHELLCAGFPCQPFSKAGSQSGFLDRSRGTLIYRIVEILRVKRPEFVLLENVAHFVRHDEGNTYQVLCRALKRLGYAVQFRQLSPHHFGIPQIRERMYLVGRRKSLNGFRWPYGGDESAEVSIRDFLDVHPSDAKPISDQMVRCLEVWQEFLDLIPPTAKLPSFPVWSMEFGASYPYEKPLNATTVATLRQCKGAFGLTLSGSRTEMSSSLPSHAKRENGFPQWKQDFIRQNREFYAVHRPRLRKWIRNVKAFPPSLQKFEWNCQGGTRNIWEYVLQFRASGVRVKRATTAPSLVAMTTTQVPIVGWEKRFMSLRELARLQSLDELKFLPRWSQAVSALGNAVNATVVEQILKQLVDS